MKVTALWYGGPSYSLGYWDGDAEHFDSLAAAVAEYDRRRTCGGYYPCVENSEMAVLFGHVTDFGGDMYPDRMITEGPQGGIRVDRT